MTRRPAPLLLIALLGLLAACGSRQRTSALDECLAREGQHANDKRLLPACVQTEEGVMATDAEYIAGVVDCELGWLATSPAALMAQAVAARTYLAAFFDRKGERAKVPIGPHFQCWRPAAHDRSKQAALATVDTVMFYGQQIINGNYVAGARTLKADCTADAPKKNGYRFASWTAMRDRYFKARKRGRRRPFKGVYWTELLITRNEGRSGDAVEGTPFASPGPRNRGALGQYAASCLGESGYDSQRILRYFYGDDIAFSFPLPDAQPIRDIHDPIEESLPPLEIPALSYRAP